MYTWDITRKLKTSTTEAVGRGEARTTHTQWHPSFRLPVLVTEPGRTTAYTYDALGNPLTETVTDTATGHSRSWSWTYTAQGLPETMADPKGAVWRYAYDAAGNRTSVTDPLGNETTFTFDAAGRVLTERLPNGLVTRYSHDARGRVLSVQRGDETTTYAHTPHGLLASVRLPSGYQVSYSYDAAQRLVAATDSFGATIHYTLDAAGNRIREEVKDAAGNIALTTARTINALNRVASVAGAQGQTTQIGYDANGQAVSQTDALNQTTRQSLDALRRTTATTFPDNVSATQAWSALDALTQVTDPKGVQTTYTYNAFGEVLSETSPDIGTITYTRDAAGHVVTTQDAKGQIAHITRDALGRPTRIDYAPGHSASFSYDSLGNVTEVQDKSGTTRYTRDSLGRILTKTQTVQDNPSNPSAFTVTYGYTAGELASIQYPSGLKVTYSRTAGRITGVDVQAPGGSWRKPKPVIAFVSSLAYTALGQPKSWSWFNGDSASRSFDQDGRMVANEFASYTYDSAGRITGITQHLWASVTANGSTTLTTTPLAWQAGYDSRNRLTSFARPGAETLYTYDANSNRLTATDKLTSDTDLDGQFDSEDFTLTTSQQLAIEGTSNRLLGMQQTITRQRDGHTRGTASTTVNYAIDANGALVSDGLRTF
jgi:YD repeat-containing protein